MKFSWLLLFMVGLWQIRPINPTTNPLAHPSVAALIDAENAEVFQSLTLYRFQVDGANACAARTCVQHYIYDFAHDATVVAVVADGELLDAWRMENATPAFNGRIEQLAQRLIADSTMVQEAIGGRRNRDEIVVMQLEHPSCPSDHLCVGTTLLTDGGSVWVLVDVTQEAIIDLWWGDAVSSHAHSEPTARQEPDCAPQTLVRNGWSLEHRISPSDGLAIADVFFNGTRVVIDVRLIQWAASYADNNPSYGYIDYIGCGTSEAGHGFLIDPQGETEINDIGGGFELRQNFQMAQWGTHCNYRYEQSYEFYDDGRWRVIGRAYGRGCGNGSYREATYQPIFRIEFALGGVGNDFFQSWTGAAWETIDQEAYFTPTHPTTADGHAFRILNENGFGYALEMGAGQFNDGGTGDNAYTYLTQYNPAEGAADMPTIGTCCNQDYRRGPEQFIDGESTAGEHLVLWYAPEAKTQTLRAFEQGNAAAPYCWTESVNEFYPCPMGPMFHPVQTPLTVEIKSAESTPPHTAVYLPISILAAGLLTGLLWLKTQEK